MIIIYAICVFSKIFGTLSFFVLEAKNKQIDQMKFYQFSFIFFIWIFFRLDFVYIFIFNISKRDPLEAF